MYYCRDQYSYDIQRGILNIYRRAGSINTPSSQNSSRRAGWRKGGHHENSWYVSQAPLCIGNFPSRVSALHWEQFQVLPECGLRWDGLRRWCLAQQTEEVPTRFAAPSPSYFSYFCCARRECSEGIRVIKLWAQIRDKADVPEALLWR